MLWIAIIVAFYLAFNLGANDVANSMGTSVGSKAVSLRQALLIAAVFELAGVLLFGQGVTQQLAVGIVDPSLFADRPQILLIGMLAVLIAAGLWMNLATWLGMPVSSSHAVVGALTGVGLVSLGPTVVNWVSLGIISGTWIVTPIVSGLLAGLLDRWVQRVILMSNRGDAESQLAEWIPWLSALIIGLFGSIVLPSAIAQIKLAQLTALPPQTIALGLEFFATMGLAGSFLFFLKAKPQVESVFARFQLVSACFVAFAHGSNDVGNAIAPLVMIRHLNTGGGLPIIHLIIPFWVMLLGGLGIVAGLGLLGRRVIATIGEGIMPLQPSAGFCAELATAMTILLASRWGLPVSTSHALVGGVVGVGIARGVGVNWETLKSIGLTWMATIPIVASLAALLQVLLIWLF